MLRWISIFGGLLIMLQHFVLATIAPSPDNVKKKK
jgi:hypothetical protein